MSNVSVVNVGYKSTNFWVVSAGRSRMLVDLGWPGTWGTMKANLDRMDVPLKELRYGLATHYHMDHAGLAQELKEHGVPLLVLEEQVSAIPAMKQWMKPTDRYTEITLHDNVVISIEGSRALLATLGFAGEIIHTPGHSDDSVSLLLDDGSVFTGDLTRPGMGEDESRAAQVAESWARLEAKGARTIYPGHGPTRAMHHPAGT